MIPEHFRPWVTLARPLSSPSTFEQSKFEFRASIGQNGQTIVLDQFFHALLARFRAAMMSPKPPENQDQHDWKRFINFHHQSGSLACEFNNGFNACLALAHALSWHRPSSCFAGNNPQ